MKTIFVALGVLLALLQYEFWFSDGGMKTVWQMKHNIVKQKQINVDLDKRNRMLISEIKDLQNGHTAIEARARNDLGMVKQGEVFYRVVDQKHVRSAA